MEEIKLRPVILRNYMVNDVFQIGLLPARCWNISFVFYSFGYGLYTIVGNETKKMNLPLFIE